MNFEFQPWVNPAPPLSQEAQEIIRQDRAERARERARVSDEPLPKLENFIPPPTDKIPYRMMPEDHITKFFQFQTQLTNRDEQKKALQSMRTLIDYSLTSLKYISERFPYPDRRYRKAEEIEKHIKLKDDEKLNAAKLQTAGIGLQQEPGADTIQLLVNVHWKEKVEDLFEALPYEFNPVTKYKLPTLRKIQLQLLQIQLIEIYIKQLKMMEYFLWNLRLSGGSRKQKKVSRKQQTIKRSKNKRSKKTTCRRRRRAK